MVWDFVLERIRALRCYSFVVFSAIAVLINAYIMSNFVQIYLRYQFRALLLPCLAMYFIISDLLKNRSLLRKHV